jgi:hypothetical protein
VNTRARTKRTRRTNGKKKAYVPVSRRAAGLKAQFFLHLYLNGHRIAVCVGHLAKGEARQVLSLGTMSGPRGRDWDLHTHREEIALAREICGDDSVFGDPSDWSPGCLADWWEPGVGRVVTNCRLVDFAFWLGMHYQRLHGAPLQVDEDGSPKWDTRAQLVPKTPSPSNAGRAS